MHPYWALLKHTDPLDWLPGTPVEGSLPWMMGSVGGIPGNSPWKHRAGQTPMWPWPKTIALLGEACFLAPDTDNKHAVCVMCFTVTISSVTLSFILCEKDEDTVRALRTHPIWASWSDENRHVTGNGENTTSWGLRKQKPMVGLVGEHSAGSWAKTQEQVSSSPPGATRPKSLKPLLPQFPHL